MPNKNKTVFQDLPKLIIVLSLIIGIGAVMGIMYYMVKSKPVADSELKTTTAPAPEIKDDTSDWKTYRNEKYGFEFKYQRDLNIDKILLVNNWQNKIESGPAEFYYNASKQRWLNRINHKNIYKVGERCIEPDDISPVTDYDIKEVECSVFQNEGNYVIKYTDPDSVDYIIVTDKNEIIFSFNKQRDNMFNKILYTFKFIEKNPIDISDWKIYRNEKYGFEFKYPDNVMIDPQKYAYVILDTFIKKEEASGEKDNEYFDLYVSGDMLREQEYGPYDRLLVNSNGVKIFQSSLRDETWFHNYIINGKVKIDFRTKESLYDDEIFNAILSTFKTIKNTDGTIWETYKNEKYGFEFKYPNFYTPYWSDFNSDLPVLTFAGPDSDNVAIAGIESHLFCCETSHLNIFIVNENISPEEWFEKNRNKYFKTDFVGENGETNSFIVSKMKTKYSGKDALEVIGKGDRLSTYKLIIIKENNYLIVINQDMQGEFLDKVLGSFKFSEPISWIQYKNKNIGISFEYPSNWPLEEEIILNDEGRFLLTFPNLRIVGINNKYEDIGHPGWIGYCAVQYENVNEFCLKENCRGAGNDTAISYRKVYRGDTGYSGMIYTNISHKFPSICFELSLSEILSEIAEKQNINYYEITEKDVEEAIKNKGLSTSIKNKINNFETLFGSIEIY